MDVDCPSKVDMHEPTNYDHEHPSIQYVHTMVHFVYGVSFRIDECHPK
jgi:hypothetical protein